EQGQQNKLLDVICSFRDQVREAARSQQQQLLQMCDKLRDHVLPPLGVRLEDYKDIKEPGKTITTWKPASISSPSPASSEKKQKEAVTSATQKEIDKWKIAAMPPMTMFADYTFDQQGLPTHHLSTPLSKSSSKSVKKA